MSNFGFEPLTIRNICCYYIPLQSSAAYTLMSMKYWSPELFDNVTFEEFQNLYLNSVIGSSLYLYGRPHARRLPIVARVLSSLFGGTCFATGSVFIWAVLGMWIPEKNKYLRLFLGIGTAVLFLHISRSYIEGIDSSSKKAKSSRQKLEYGIPIVYL